MRRRRNWRHEGQEPDYRFSLANERTFLAWIRTALAILAGAVLLEQFVTNLEPRGLLIALAASFALLSAALCVGAYLRWRGNEIAMRHSRPLPHSWAIPLISASTLVAAAVIVYLQLRR